MPQITTEALEVTDTAVRIDDEGRTTGTYVVYVEVGSAPVEWGGPALEYGDGIPILAGEKEYFDLADATEIYLVAEDTATVRIGKGGI